MDKEFNKETLNIKTYVCQLFVRQLFVGSIVALALSVYQQAINWSLWWGLLAGWGDNALVLRGIAQGMKKDFVKAAGHMHSTMFLRLGLLLIAVVLGFYLGLTAYSIFGAYLFLHVALLGNMIILAKKK